MPATSGSAICSRASRPRRRVTKLARLSSPLAVRRGRTRSRAIRTFPRQEKSGEVTKGPSRAGARRGGGEEEEALRQGVEPAAADDVGPAGAVVGPAEPRAEADPLAEGERPRLLGDEGGRPRLDQEDVGGV